MHQKCQLLEIETNQS